jgi:calpain-7
MWQRIYNAYRFGDAIATLGTGRLTPQEEDGLGLAGEHDYAVLDMKEINDRHMLLVKNPWCDGTIWKEPGSGTGCLADAQWTEDLRRSLAENATLSPGTFWIEFEEVIRNFESMYLNWNPGLFKYVETYHFSWAIPTVSPPECFIHNPQYSIHSAKGGIVWVLLSRHTTTEEHRILKTSAHSKSRIENPLGFISLYVFDVGGHRVQLSDDALQRGAFVDSPQTLARLNVPASTTYTLVVAQQGLPLPKHSFTLSTFSREPIVVQMAEHPYPHSKSLEGAWTSRSAGGNAGSASYGSNPQFSITLSSSTDLALLLETDRPELPVHITIVWGGGERVSTVTGRDIIGASGDYRRGCALIKLGNVGRGKYTIVCSTFEPKQLAQFTLRVESSTICEIRPIANEAAGRLSMNLPRLRMPPGTDRMLAPISVKRLTRLRVIAKHAGGNAGGISGTRSPLKVGLEVGQGPNKRILATSGNGGFGDSPGGLRLGDSDVSPDMMGRGGVWLVIERFAGRKESEEVEVEILSDGAVEVQPWGSGEG